MKQATLTPTHVFVYLLSTNLSNSPMLAQFRIILPSVTGLHYLVTKHFRRALLESCEPSTLRTVRQVATAIVDATARRRRLRPWPRAGGAGSGGRTPPTRSPSTARILGCRVTLSGRGRSDTSTMPTYLDHLWWS